MIKNIKIKNFRNFENKEYIFDKWLNLIIWDNWKGKTNILEAVSLLTINEIYNIPFNDLTKLNENVFFINWNFLDNEDNKSISISYDKSLNKKKYILDWKATTKKSIKKKWFLSCFFSPLVMNLFYLSPSKRRDFIDNILINCYEEYEELLKKNTSIVKNRNKVLKNIKEWFSKKEEIIFWNKNFIEISKKIYKYRINLIKYFEKKVKHFTNYLDFKVKEIDFVYQSKTDLNNIKGSIEKYLEDNIDRDIILQKTNIWIHVDDFDIIIEKKYSLVNFASRGEIKSLILGLKFLEIDFIEEKTNKKPILLIDDLMSEIDEKHQKEIFSKIQNYQSIITSIYDIEAENINTIYL